MSNIFISYAKKDIEFANNLRLALKSEGFSIWWDDNLTSGSPWQEEIHNALRKSNIILVIWTSNSKKSDWVKHEASVALLKGNLIQVHVGDISIIPHIFHVIQASDFTDWNKRENHQDFRYLVSSIKTNLKKRRFITLFKILSLVAMLSTIIAIMYVNCNKIGNINYSTNNIPLQSQKLDNYIPSNKPSEEINIDYLNPYDGDYLNGQKLFKTNNYKEAFALYNKCAKKGNTFCMNRLAEMYAKGLFVVKDKEKSIEWSIKSVENGAGLHAMTNVAVSYLNIDKYCKAIEWFNKIVSTKNIVKKNEYYIKASLNLKRLKHFEKNCQNTNN